MALRDRRSTCLFHRSGLRRVAPTTMPSADFYAAIRAPCDALSPVAGTTAQTSRGKIDRLRRTPAGSTTPVLDGRGLRGCLPARPAGKASLSGSCPSGRGFAPRFFQAPPRGGLRSRGARPCVSLILRHHQAGQRTLTSKLSIMLGTQPPGRRKAPPDHRLHDAIHGSNKVSWIFVAYAPRNDDGSDGESRSHRVRHRIEPVDHDIALGFIDAHGHVEPSVVKLR